MHSMRLCKLLLLPLKLTRSQTLESAFGTLARVSDPEDERSTAAYLDLRKACHYPLELLILQESIAAFEDDFVEMQVHQLPAMLKALAVSHPNSTFTVGFFSDKPFPPFGEAGDFCQRLNELTHDGETLTTLYGAQVPNGGGDKLQNNLGALLAAAESRTVGWGGNELATKLIVHVTDSAPHFYDGVHSEDLEVPQGHFKKEREEEQCLREYYPSPNQVKASLRSQPHLHVAHLVYDPEYLQGPVARSWVWFNRYHGQTDHFVNLREKDSSDFWHKLHSIISRIDELECRANRTVALASTKSDCGPNASYCKNGVSVRLGFKPDELQVEVQP